MPPDGTTKIFITKRQDKKGRFSILGSNKHDISTHTDATLDDLMGQVAEVTGVPVPGQKLIVNGRALTCMDKDKRISDCRISPGCKVMLLGKKHDPAQDETYQKVLAIQKKTILDYTTLLKVCNEL